MKTETIETSFFYFRPANKEVYHNSMMGDAITLARDIRSFKFNISRYEYLEIEGGIQIELEEVILNLKFSGDSKVLDVSGKFEDSINEDTCDLCTFLHV